MVPLVVVAVVETFAVVALAAAVGFLGVVGLGCIVAVAVVHGIGGAVVAWAHLAAVAVAVAAVGEALAGSWVARLVDDIEDVGDEYFFLAVVLGRCCCIVVVVAVGEDHGTEGVGHVAVVANVVNMVHW